MSPLALLIVMVIVGVLATIAIIGKNVVDAKRIGARTVRQENQLLSKQLRIAKTELRTIRDLGGESSLAAQVALEDIDRLEEQAEITGGNK